MTFSGHSLGYAIDVVRSENLNYVSSKDFADPITPNRGGLPLNKNDLVAAIASRTGLSKSDAAKAVDGITASITSALQSGTEVRLVGFGTFSVSHRNATTGRNPRTGERIQIAATNVPKFKSGKALKAAVN